MKLPNGIPEPIQAIADAVGGTVDFVSGPLPDGSGFATMSFPLPKDHWLYAPRADGWDEVRDDFSDTPHPILTRALADQVAAAVRYAVRASTMCGKEMDFDPDAMVQNAVYALCGPVVRNRVEVAPS